MVKIKDPLLQETPKAPAGRKKSGRNPQTRGKSLKAAKAPPAVAVPVDEDPLAELPPGVPIQGTPEDVLQAHTEESGLQAPPTTGSSSLEDRVKADFRLLLVIVWRALLGCDPNRMQLDMAWWLQHGPDRSVTMAFRGFSKSWITGVYALWRLLRDPNELVLVVSGSMTRAVATTTWCFNLIHLIPILQHLKPLPHQRQSSKSFDVGPSVAQQSPSFQAMGIGSQMAGFRASCIIPDDVETQTNSITVTMRTKIADATKEFDSVLLPGGVIRYLGTPHAEESLYNDLAKRGYASRLWPARYPTPEQAKRYGDRLAPIVLADLARDPSLVGRTIMPERFTDAELERRRLALGTSEFDLQFMLDTSGSDKTKYPLKVGDLVVMALDKDRGPETIIWSSDPQHRIGDLQVLGFNGDYYHQPVMPLDVAYSPYTRVVGCVDNSGRGTDETAIAIVAELNGRLFWLDLWAGTGGFDPATLDVIARRCVRYRVNKLRVESNFGDGMFAALLRPVLEEAWRKANDALQKAHRAGLRRGEEPGGTEIEEYKASNQMIKERRILSVLEPVTQQHRLVVNKAVLEWDYESLAKIDAQETRHQFAWGYQFTHLTKDPDCLRHDDRLDALAGAVADFADILGVSPDGMAQSSAAERDEEEWARIYGELDDEDPDTGLPVGSRPSRRARASLPVSR